MNDLLNIEVNILVYKETLILSLQYYGQNFQEYIKIRYTL